MARILVRSGKSPLDAIGPEASLGATRTGAFATNVGNYLFTDAVQRLLSVAGNEVVSDGYSTEGRGVGAAHLARVSEEFDHLAIPLANAFRETFVPSLRRLTRVVEQLTIPVSVIGVGAHLPLTGDRVAPPEAVEVYTAFVRAVLEKSPSIGVRGEFTRDFVLGLGFDDDQVDVIGCPSVYLHGPDHQVRPNDGTLDAGDPIGLNLTLTSAGVLGSAYPELFARVVEEFPRATYVGQVSSELSLLLWGRAPGAPVDPRLPHGLDHPLYREDRVRFFVDTKPWTEFLGAQKLVLGTRIHGSMAGILGGTPSFLATHDARTRELAEYHEIPHRHISTLGPDTRIEELYAEADYGAFNAGMHKRYEVLTAFLDRHGLPHAGRPGADTSAFDHAWETTPRPPAVRGPFAPEEEFRVALAGRLAWLRQGVDVDRSREDLGRVRAFGPEREEPTLADLHRELRTLRRDVRGLSTRLDRSRQRNDALSARVAELEAARRRPLRTRLRALAGRLRRGTPSA